ncbi:hypothetical protein FACS189418_1690 [Clostridia bacterium]|nr:hypothetical protein FACS189418_1690 [Clostridia bacterium]
MLQEQKRKHLSKNTLKSQVYQVLVSNILALEKRSRNFNVEAKSYDPIKFMSYPIEEHKRSNLCE